MQSPDWEKIKKNSEASMAGLDDLPKEWRQLSYDFNLNTQNVIQAYRSGLTIDRARSQLASQGHRPI